MSALVSPPHASGNLCSSSGLLRLRPRRLRASTLASALGTRSRLGVGHRTPASASCAGLGLLFARRGQHRGLPTASSQLPQLSLSLSLSSSVFGLGCLTEAICFRENMFRPLLRLVEGMSAPWLYASVLSLSKFHSASPVPQDSQQPSLASSRVASASALCRCSWSSISRFGRAPSFTLTGLLFQLPASTSGDLSSVSASGGSIPALFGPHDTSRTLSASAFGGEARGLLSPPFLSPPPALCMDVMLAVEGCWEEEGGVGGSNTEEKPFRQEGAGLLPASKLEAGLHSTTGSASDISPFELWLPPSAPESAMVPTSIREQEKPEEVNSEMGFSQLLLPVTFSLPPFPPKFLPF